MFGSGCKHPSTFPTPQQKTNINKHGSQEKPFGPWSKITKAKGDEDLEEYQTWAANLPDELWAKWIKQTGLDRVVDPDSSSVSYIIAMPDQTLDLVVHQKDLRAESL